MTIKGFVTNLGKYNEGELVGEWVELPIDEDEFEEVLKEIGIDGERYEEYFWTDWECKADLGLGEYISIDELNDLAERLEEWDDDTFLAACEHEGERYVLDTNPDDWLLYSDIQTDYDLGYYWAEESGCYNAESLGALGRYIDYEAFGRDIRLESDGCHTNYGWIEHIG